MIWMIIRMIQMSVTSPDRHRQTDGRTSSKILMLYTIGPFGAIIVSPQSTGKGGIIINTVTIVC